MRVTEVFASNYILIFMLGLELLSLPYLQSSRCSSYLNLNAFSIMHPSSVQTQGSFASIQQVINDAENGTTIIIPAGIFYEHVVINKTITLVGEENFTSIIDGTNNGTVVEITADSTIIRGFKLQNSGYGWDRNGVYAHNADNFTIESNFLHNVCHNIKIGFSNNSQILGNVINGTMKTPTMYGIRIENSTNCIAVGNSVSDCVGGIHLQNTTNSILARNNVFNNDQGIRFYSPCLNNGAYENIISNNVYDGMISMMPQNITFANNIIFHNNFVNNTNPFINTISGFTWDKGYPSGGNYWTRHDNTDVYKGLFQNESGSDGIGDFQYTINSNNIDRYPLAHPWSSLHVHNIDTGSGFNTIQEAIDSSETLDGHTLWVSSNTYFENINIHKSLTLIGENPTTTIIDANRTGTALCINANDTTFMGFTVQNSGLNYQPYDCGILLNHTSENNISHNMVKNNCVGIYAYYSEDNFIENNIVIANVENGLLLWYSGNNTLTNNDIRDNLYGFSVFGGSREDFQDAINNSNTVDGKPIKYILGVEDQVFDEQLSSSTMYLIDCENITVKNLSFTGNGHGVFCYNVNNSMIENVTASDNSYGIYLQNSINNTVRNCICPDNWVGICLQNSDNNYIGNNTATDNEKGASFYEADNNMLEGNNLGHNYYGIRLFSSNFNLIFHNNLVDNTEQADLISAHQNVWNNDIEGNFWSEHNGTDADQNGICDSKYIVDVENNDNYPLLGKFHNFSVHDNEQTFYVSVISNSTILNFTYADSSIMLIVNGSDQDGGFCRICVPHTLVEPEIKVLIDGGTAGILYANYTVNDDGLYRWIYFAYQHSEHEITVLPESFQMLLLCLSISAAVVCITKSKLARFNRKGQGNVEYLSKHTFE